MVLSGLECFPSSLKDPMLQFVPDVYPRTYKLLTYLPTWWGHYIASMLTCWTRSRLEWSSTQLAKRRTSKEVHLKSSLSKPPTMVRTSPLTWSRELEKSLWSLNFVRSYHLKLPPSQMRISSCWRVNTPVPSMSTLTQKPSVLESPTRQCSVTRGTVLRTGTFTIT